MYFGMKVPNPMKAKTKKMVDPKFAMNSLLLRRRFSAGKNASLVFEELAPFSSFEKDNFAAVLQRLFGLLSFVISPLSPCFLCWHQSLS